MEKQREWLALLCLVLILPSPTKKLIFFFAFLSYLARFYHKLRDKAGLQDAAKMVLFDVLVHSPLIYFPCYYTVKESIGGKKWNPVDWVKDGVGKYRKNMKEDLTAMVKVTVPSDCVQVVMPVHTR